MSTLWTWPPEYPVLEALEWTTDVIGHHDGTEQRIEDRYAPRQSFEMICMASGTEAQRMRALLATANISQILMPIWPEMVYVGAIAGGAGTITLDTTAGDYRTGTSQAVIWQSSGSAESISITTVNAGSLVLTGTVSGTYTGAWVAPLRQGKIIGPIRVKMERAAGSATGFATTASFTWVSDQNTRLTGANYCATTYDNGVEILMVMTAEPLHQSGLSGSIEWPGNLLDNGTGITLFDDQPDYELTATDTTWMTTSQADLYAFRKWLHLLSGRRGSWWQPSYGKDVTIAQTLTPPDAAMIITDIDYVASFGATPDSPAASHLYLVWADDGTIEIRHIDGAAAGPGATEETLTLDSALHDTATDASFSRACFLGHSRMAGDRVEIRHVKLGIAEVSMSVLSCPWLTA